MANTSVSAFQISPQNPANQKQPGLIAPKTDPTQAQASTWNVTPDQTVQGQLKGLLSQNNPIVEAGKTKALQFGNQRGLLNSSMAAESGAKAAYDYAVPIATADASTMASAGKENANLATTTNITNATLKNQAQIAAGNNAATMGAASISADSAQKIAALNRDTQIKLQEMDEKSRATLQSSALANTSFNNTLDLLYKVSADPNMDAQSKQNTIDNLIASLQTAIRVTSAVAGVDTGSLLKF